MTNLTFVQINYSYLSQLTPRAALLLAHVVSLQKTTQGPVFISAKQADATLRLTRARFNTAKRELTEAGLVSVSAEPGEPCAFSLNTEAIAALSKSGTKKGFIKVPYADLQALDAPAAILAGAIAFKQKLSPTQKVQYTAADIAAELNMKRRVADGAKKQLASAGVLTSELIGDPARLYYSVQEQTLDTIRSAEVEKDASLVRKAAKRKHKGVTRTLIDPNLHFTDTHYDIAVKEHEAVGSFCVSKDAVLPVFHKFVEYYARKAKYSDDWDHTWELWVERGLRFERIDEAKKAAAAPKPATVTAKPVMETTEPITAPVMAVTEPASGGLPTFTLQMPPSPSGNSYTRLNQEYDAYVASKNARRGVQL